MHLPAAFFCLRVQTAGEREKDYHALSRWQGVMEGETTGGMVQLRHRGDTGTHGHMVEEIAETKRDQKLAVLRGSNEFTVRCHSSSELTRKETTSRQLD